MAKSAKASDAKLPVFDTNQWRHASGVAEIRS